MSGHNRQQNEEKERPPKYKEGKLQKLGVGRESITKMNIEIIDMNPDQK